MHFTAIADSVEGYSEALRELCQALANPWRRCLRIAGWQEDEVIDVVVKRRASVQRRGHVGESRARMHPGNREGRDVVQLCGMDVVAAVSEPGEERRGACDPAGGQALLDFHQHAWLAVAERGHRSVQHFLLMPLDIDLDEACGPHISIVEPHAANPDEIMAGVAG